MLLRIPMHSEVEEVIEYADYSLNSELSTMKLLGEAAKKAGKTHSVVIMVDLGDLREGVWADNIGEFVNEAVKIDGISIKGFGVNLTCYGGVIPDGTNLGELVKIAKAMQDKYGIDIEILSGGNSSSVYLLKDGAIPEGINNLRLGEVILLGRETAFGNEIEELNKDVFVISGEIVELKDKPSMPLGNIGMDAFGNRPVYVDRGIMKRAIVAMGRQDVEISGLKPVDDGIEVIGGSSDHTILNLTGSDRTYKVGDIVQFYPNYACLLKAATSPYVEKVIVKE